MPDEHPIDVLADEIRSLGAVCDLLLLSWQPETIKRNMHLVDSYNLYTLLKRIQGSLSGALDDLADERREQRLQQ
jgi:hypothetical protein